MRLFIAIQFEENILNALTAFQNDMRCMGVTGNYTKRENLHLTLAFIGDYGNPDEVLDTMEQVEFKPIDVELEGVGSFGELFWAGIKNNPRLEGYVRRLHRQLSENDIPYGNKRFLPHITLIRQYKYLGGGEIPVYDPPKGSMRATHISLMKSERGKNGMIYTEIGSIDC